MSDYAVARVIGVDGEVVEAAVQVKKPYVAPQIVHELEIETRAGSPIMFGIDPSDGQIQNPWDPDYNRQ
jgi:hypothetical protein